jgi:hypothetical protein
MTAGKWGGGVIMTPLPWIRSLSIFVGIGLRNVKKTVLKRQTPPISKSISLLKRIKTLTILKSLC